VSESAIAAGIRRIEAVTGTEAEALVDEMKTNIGQARELLSNAQDIAGAIRKLQEENSAYKKQAEEFAKQKAAALSQKLLSAAVDRNGVKFIELSSIEELGADAAMLRDAASILQKNTEAVAMAAAWQSDGKPQLLLMYSEPLVKAGRNAGADIREAAKFIQGGGGGQAGLATAGGRNAEGLAEALKTMVSKI